MSTLVAPETLPIPASHLDLLTGPICGVLTTMGGDGQPQSSLVWVDHDGECRTDQHDAPAAEGSEHARQPEGQPAGGRPG